MKLKVFVLRKKIDDLKKKLEELRAKDADFEKRKADLVEAFGEVNDETPEETRNQIEEEMNQFDQESDQHEADKKDLEEEVRKAEEELKGLEEKQEEVPAEDPAPAPEDEQPETRERGVNTMKRRFKDLSYDEQIALVKREDVKKFLNDIRAMAGRARQERAVTGTALLIPEVILPLIQSSVDEYSKLKKHVKLETLSGTGRQIIQGNIPEAVWTECCAKINELSLGFTDVELDCYKVAGFIPVCNATLEDNDVDLADKILTALGQAIGYALDKAIVFGTGTKMPVGFAPGLATASKISLSGKTGAALFAAILKGMKNVKHAYGELFWVMTESTKMDLMAEAVSINAAGAIVSGVSNTMPIIGGAIETLDFVKDGEIYGGYGQRYLLGERKGIQLATSTEVRFLEDETVFKGTARYDGKPVFQDAFVGFGLSAAATAALDTNHPFAADTANAESLGGD